MSARSDDTSRVRTRALRSPLAGLGSMLVAAAALIALAVISRPAHAQDYESHTVTIDATTPQPVDTGFIPTTSTGELIILAEGNIRVFPSASRYEDGWFGPAGQTRLERIGQPIPDEMPFGALVGGFSANIANYRYVGRMGAFHLEPQYVGQEFRVALNMSDADHAIMEGQVTVTVIYILDGSADLARLEITDGTRSPFQPVSSRRPGIGSSSFLTGRFRPAFPSFGTRMPISVRKGCRGFNRAGQPYPEAPTAASTHTGSTPRPGSTSATAGPGTSAPPALETSSHLNLNLDPADLAGADGRFVVNVVRVPQ